MYNSFFRKGSIFNAPQMLGAVVVHPDQRVFPIRPEPISKSDDSTKNDCEQNAIFVYGVLR